MGRKKPIKEVTTRYVPQDDDREAEPLIEVDAAEETFAQFRAKFGTDGVLVKIYRRTPRGFQYCFSGLPSEIDEEVVRLFHAKQPFAREEGEYSARCFVAGEPREGFTILISPQMPQHAEMASSGGMALQGDTARVLERILERLDARPAPEPLSALADAMAKLHGMMPKPPEMPLDQIMKAVELGRMMNGGGEASEWTPILKNVLENAGPLISGIISGLGRRGGAPMIENNGGNMAGSTQSENAMLAAAIAFLKRKCLAGSDPSLYIAIVLDNADDAKYERLLHKVLTEDFSSFAAIDPELSNAPFNAWFKFIYDGLRRAIEESNKMATDTGGEAGNEADTSSDARPRKAGKSKS